MSTPQIERLCAQCHRLRLYQVETEISTLLEVGPAGPGDETIEASKVLKDRIPENFPFTAFEYLSTGIVVETR